jgi:small subunit ribosomal protein S1
MPYRPEDLELDEDYWRSLITEADQLNLPVTRPENYSQPPAPKHQPISTTDPSHEALWAMLRKMMETGEQLEVEVTGCNRGGLIAVYRSIRGFIPSSHVLLIAPDNDENERRSHLASQIGNRLKVRIIELDAAQERVVFSEKEQREAELPRDIPDVLFKIQAEQTYTGTVTNLTAFGAFVDLGGYEGLVHVSELAWSRINHPRDLLQIGQEVQVYVMSIAPSEGRIALSLKRAKQNPWEGIERRYVIGQTVTGLVTNVVQFGAFVKVEDDLEGLVHVSELADGSFLHPRNIVKEGDKVTARVIGVDAQQRRLALSLKSPAA